jgi:cytochrome P450
MTFMSEPTTERTRFPMRRSCPFQPPEQYAALRDTEPITRAELPTGRTAWLITRHDHVRRILTDPRVSSDRAAPGFPRLMAVSPEVLRDSAISLIGMDPPVHTEHRRSVINEFTVKRMRSMRPRIQEIVDTCIDGILAADRPVDLVHALSLPVPSLVICELLGVPYADHDFFQQCTAVLVSRRSTGDQRTAAFGELRTYLDNLVSAKEKDPGDDLIGRMALKYRNSGLAGHEELVALARLLLVAGHETTANMISLSAVALLENPRQLAALRADPALLPQAVEELLRYFSIADQAGSRIALEDIEIGGVLIRKGEGVITLGLSANWDERVFDRPEDLDIERGARHHVAFGYGAHQCLGQNLARVELEVVIETLFRRIPGLRLAVDLAEVAFKYDSAIYGIAELPVTW